jgi:hypothetical protein
VAQLFKQESTLDNKESTKIENSLSLVSQPDKKREFTQSSEAIDAARKFPTSSMANKLLKNQAKSSGNLNQSTKIESFSEKMKRESSGTVFCFF